MSIQQHIDRINSEVSEQGGLIEQIKYALQGKAVEEGTIVDTADATATEDDISEGATAYVNGRKLTGRHVCKSTVGVVTTTVDKMTALIRFNVPREPKAFSICPLGDIELNNAEGQILNIVYDGTVIRGIYDATSGSSYIKTYTAKHSSSYYTWYYADGVLTVSSTSSANGGMFDDGITYQLMYLI